MNVIVVDGLRKSYGDRLILDDVSFSVEHGSVVAILGPNGAGKTTTIEILEGHRSRDSGVVDVLGHDPQRPGRSFREQIGVVLQETRHDPYLTVSEAVDLFAGWFPDPMSTLDALTAVGLRDCAETRTARLSGGQQRRLDVALGLVGRPRLLFLDEPTTGFDPSARREAWAHLTGLRDLGTTIVLTTHYLDEAAALADHVIVLAHGRIVAAGPPDAIGQRNHRHSVSFRIQPDTNGSAPEGGTVSNGYWNATVSDITSTIHHLSRWAQQEHIALEDLTVTRPSLEDIYLELIE